MKQFSVLIRVVLLAVFVPFAPLPATAADTTQLEGVTITPGDIMRLLTALHTSLSPDDRSIPLVVSILKPSEMPPYDKEWHYAGITNDPDSQVTLAVWINNDLKGTELQDALKPAFILALTDGGYGGPAFKKLYDIYADKDAALPQNAPDPFLNRRHFASVLLKMLDPLKTLQPS